MNCNSYILRQHCVCSFCVVQTYRWAHQSGAGHGWLSGFEKKQQEEQSHVGAEGRQLEKVEETPPLHHHHTTIRYRLNLLLPSPEESAGSMKNGIVAKLLTSAPQLGSAEEYLWWRCGCPLQDGCFTQRFNLLTVSAESLLSLSLSLSLSLVWPHSSCSASVCDSFP